MQSVMGQKQDANIDAENAVLAESTPRALYRRSKTQLQLGRPTIAVHGLWKGLEQEPCNQQFREEFEDACGAIPVSRYFWQPNQQRVAEYPVSIHDSTCACPAASPRWTPA
jgi:hypothetical protein